MATWTEPKTDWEATDPLTYQDYNRIKNNLEYLNDIYNELYGEYDIDFGDDMAIDQMFKASSWNKFEDCVEHFQRSGIIYTFGEKSHYEDNGRMPNFVQLNRLEKCILNYSYYDVDVTGVSLSPKKLALVGSTFPETVSEQITATVSPSNAFNKTVFWSTDNMSILTVDENGKLTKKAPGQSTVSVMTDDGGFTDTCEVYNIVPVTSIQINNIQLEENKTISIADYITILPSEANFVEYTYSSSNTSIFTVDADGVITGVNDGNATLTITAIQNPADLSTPSVQVTKTVNVEVTEIVVPVTGITLDKSTLMANKSSTYQLVATITPADATNKNITWTSSNTSKATVSSTGLVTTKSSTGSVTITARTTDGGFTATCEVTIATITAGSYWVQDGKKYPIVLELVSPGTVSTLMCSGVFPVSCQYGNGGVYYQSTLHRKLNDIITNNFSENFRSFSFLTYIRRWYAKTKYETGNFSYGSLDDSWFIPSYQELGYENIYYDRYPFEKYVDYGSTAFTKPPHLNKYFIKDWWEDGDVPDANHPRYWSRSTDLNRGAAYGQSEVPRTNDSVSLYSSYYICPAITVRGDAKVYPTKKNGFYIIDFDKGNDSIAIKDLPAGSYILDIPLDAEAAPTVIA